MGSFPETLINQQTLTSSSLPSLESLSLTESGSKTSRPISLARSGNPSSHALSTAVLKRVPQVSAPELGSIVESIKCRSATWEPVSYTSLVLPLRIHCSLFFSQSASTGQSCNIKKDDNECVQFSDISRLMQLP